MTATIEDLDLNLIWDMALPCVMNEHDPASEQPAEYRLVYAKCPGCQMELNRPILSCVTCHDSILENIVFCIGCNHLDVASAFRIVFEKL